MPARPAEAGTIRIGTDDKQTATYIAGISGTTLGGAAQPVVVKSNGQLGTAPAALGVHGIARGDRRAAAAVRSTGCASSCNGVVDDGFFRRGTGLLARRAMGCESD